MKKGISVLLALFVTTSLILAGCSQGKVGSNGSSAVTTNAGNEADQPAPANADSKTYELLFATFESEETGYMTQGLKQFGDDLMERSGGRVHVTYSYSTALGAIPEYYDLVVQGVADVSFAPVFMAQGLFPIGELTLLPFNIPTSEIGTQAMAELYKQGLLDANYDNGVKTLFVSTGESNAIFHTSKPINTPADLKGERIIIRSQPEQACVTAMGGAPTTIQGADVYVALEKGTVEGQSVGISACPTWGWCEVQKYMTPEFLGCATWALLINEKTYNSLPADIQKIIDEMAADNKYGSIGAKQLDKVSQEATQCFIDHGGVIVEWGDEVYDEIDQLFAPIWQAWIDEREAKGLNPRAALDAMYNALLDLGVERPALGYKPQ